MNKVTNREKAREQKYYSNLNLSDGPMNLESEKTCLWWSCLHPIASSSLPFPVTPPIPPALSLSISIIQLDAVSMAILMDPFDKVTFT